MSPTDFPQANATFGAASDLDESQIKSIRCRVGQLNGGPLDGAKQFVVAWQPDAEDLARLQNGGPMYISFLGGMPPHSVVTELDGNDCPPKNKALATFWQITRLVEQLEDGPTAGNLNLCMAAYGAGMQEQLMQLLKPFMAVLVAEVERREQARKK